ncbi:hypothetical protein NQZ68_020898 [Dissostichus eleginoides]|nr:hypothetical protein NQZ68_020898 [Dissostichus eleginoides]
MTGVPGEERGSQRRCEERTASDGGRAHQQLRRLLRAGRGRISEEFHRITSKDLLGMFGAAFDKHVPCLLKLYWARKGAFGQKMEDLLEKLDEQDTDHEERLLRGVSVAILTVIEDDDAAISPNVRDVAVVLEGTIERRILFGKVRLESPKDLKEVNVHQVHLLASVQKQRNLR